MARRRRNPETNALARILALLGLPVLGHRTSNVMARLMTKPIRRELYERSTPTLKTQREISKLLKKNKINSWILKDPSSPIATSQRIMRNIATKKPFVFNYVNIPTRSRAAALHEAYHAIQTKNSPLLVALRAIGRRPARPYAALAGLVLGATPHDEISKIAPYVAGAMTLPTLLDEALASGGALSHIARTSSAKETLKAVKTLGLAGGSYLAYGASAVGLSILARKLMKKLEEELARKREA